MYGGDDVIIIACGLNGLNVLVFPELRNSETRERSESYVEDLGTLAEATWAARKISAKFFIDLGGAGKAARYRINVWPKSVEAHFVRVFVVGFWKYF